MTKNKKNESHSASDAWTNHKREQLLRMAALPLEKKLEWLEEAQLLAKRLLGSANPKSTSHEQT